jgi:protein CWC15
MFVLSLLAHRPTFDPARGKEAQRGPAYHQRLLPAHTQLKVRKPGQGGDADNQPRDLRAELLQAEAAHFAKIKGGPAPTPEVPEASTTAKRQLENGDGEGEEDPDAKRRRILEESRDIDADSEDDDEDDSSEDDSDDEDETAELQRELEKIKRERAEKREQEVRTSFPVQQSTMLTTRRSGTREGR